MAVEIPVVIDIERAFQDAANRVKTAMQPLKQKIDGDVLKVKFKMEVPTDELKKFGGQFKLVSQDVEEGTSIIERSFEQLFAKGKPTLDELKQALASYKSQLSKMEMSGKNMADINALQQAIILVQEYVTWRKRAVDLTQEQYDQHVRAKMEEERRLFVIQQEAKTISEISQRLSALRGQLENLTPGTKAWRETVREIQKSTEALTKYNRQIDELNTKAGSINRINLKLRELTDKWNAMSRAQKFDKDGNLKASAQRIVDKYKQLTAEAAKFGKTLEQTVNGTGNATRKLNRVLNETEETIGRTNSRLVVLLKNAARLFALHAAGTFVRNIREVTAEFELQRVALGSIIHDTERADSLFKQIKAKAVESPFEIKDLVSYTKQLSAYRVETDKLFDVTMRLADVSAGLGVDMSRLILAYGQVRAASVLRGQELRQFTEAGIPLVDLLAEKFSKLNGRMVSTAEVFELISKRAVPFSMIEEIFNDMTDAGGVFYKMQEKQAETLLGQWNNLKDAASIMYDEIGNTSTVRGAMEDLISSAKYLMQNWHFIANAIKAAGVQFLTFKAISLFLPILTKNMQMLRTATLQYARAKAMAESAQGKGFLAMYAKGLMRSAAATRAAASATTAWARGLLQVRAFLTGNWLGLAASAITMIASAIFASVQESQRLNKELAKIAAESSIRADQSSRNFVRLAETAVNAAEGSKEQTDAVNELVRTYGDLLPSSDKVVEKLREMKGNYEAVTTAIRQKIEAQRIEQQIDEIQSEYSSKITKAREKVKKALKKEGLSSDEISIILSDISNAVSDGIIAAGEDLDTQVDKIGQMIYKTAGKYVRLFDVSMTGGQTRGRRADMFTDYVSVISQMDVKIKDVEEDISKSTGVIGVYSREWKDLQKTLSDYAGVGATKFAQSEDKIRNSVEKSIEFIQNKFTEQGIDITPAIEKGFVDFNIIEKMLDSINDGAAQASLRGIIKNFQKEYEKLVPDDKIREASKLALMDIAETTGISMDKLTAYIKAAGKDSKEYLKELQESLQQYKDKVGEMRDFNAQYEGQTPVRLYDEKEIKETDGMAKALELLVNAMSKLITLPLTGGRTKGTSDKLQKLRQSIDDVTNAYKKYIELTKYMDKGAAQSAIDTLFPDLKGWEPTYDNMVQKLEAMLKSYDGDADATRLIEQALVNIKFDKIKDDLKDVLDKIQKEIKRSAQARNFYEDMLGMTGDENIAKNLTIQIYGEGVGIGKEFSQRITDEMTQTLDAAVQKGLMSSEQKSIFTPLIETNNFEQIRKQLEQLPEGIRPVFERLLDEQEQFDADWMKNFYNTFSKTRTYAERIADLESQRNQAVKEAAERGESVAAVNKHFDEAVAKVRVSAIKDSYEWTKTFEELDRVGTPTLQRLIAKLKVLIALSGKNMPTEDLKNLTQQIIKAEDELSNRSPFTNIYTSFKDLISAMKGVAHAREDVKAEMEAYGEVSEDTALKASSAIDEEKKSVAKLGNAFQTTASYIQSVSDVINQVFDMVGADELSDSKAVIDGITKGLGIMVGVLTAIGAVINIITNSNPLILAISVALGAIVGLASILMNLKTAKFERGIERQERAIKNLERAYKRLDNAIKDAFGEEYISDYNQQVELLEAKIAAIQKQIDATAEMVDAAKGSKRKEYQDQLDDLQDSLIDTENEIANLHKDMQSFLAGTDITSAAKDFAEAWIDAYKSFGSTTAAMKEKFREMIDNMVTSSLAAKVMEGILKPVFDEIDAYAKIGKLDEAAIAEIAGLAAKATGEAQVAMTALMQRLAHYGISLRGTGASLSGISKDIAGASEESILGLAAGINTQNYYMSYMPTISQNVAAIAAILSNGKSVVTEPGANLTSMFGDELFRGQMESITSDIHELKRLIGSVIMPKGTSMNTAVVATN